MNSSKPPRMNGDTKRMVGLATLVATALGVFLFLRSIPTEAEVISLIETRSPYVVDQRLILDKLMSVDNAVRAIHEKVDKLVTDVAVLTATAEKWGK